jgi:hypothetical protein
MLHQHMCQHSKHGVLPEPVVQLQLVRQKMPDNLQLPCINRPELLCGAVDPTAVRPHIRLGCLNDQCIQQHLQSNAPKDILQSQQQLHACLHPVQSLQAQNSSRRHAPTLSQKFGTLSTTRFRWKAQCHLSFVSAQSPRVADHPQTCPRAVCLHHCCAQCHPAAPATTSSSSSEHGISIHIYTEAVSTDTT